MVLGALAQFYSSPERTSQTVNTFTVNTGYIAAILDLLIVFKLSL